MTQSTESVSQSINQSINQFLTINELNEFSSPPSPTKWRIALRLSILAVGDSLTQRGGSLDGWVTMLNHRYQRKADVLNRGYSGYNSDWSIAMIDQLIDEQIWPFAPQQLVILCLGANDAVFDIVKQHVPLDRFKSNMIQLSNQLTSRGAHLLLVTPPATDALGWARFQQQRDGTPDLFLSRSTEQTGKYAQAVREVGKQLDVPVVDLFELLTSDQSINPYLCDGLHFNTRGHQIVFEAIAKSIQTHFPDLAVTNVPMDGPGHDKLDPDTYINTFKQNQSQ